MVRKADGEDSGVVCQEAGESVDGEVLGAWRGATRRPGPGRPARCSTFEALNAEGCGPASTPWRSSGSSEAGKSPQDLVDVLAVVHLQRSRACRRNLV